MDLNKKYDFYPGHSFRSVLSNMHLFLCEIDFSINPIKIAH